MATLGRSPGAAPLTSADIPSDSITGAKVADDAIDSEHYAAGSVDAAHVAADVATTAGTQTFTNKTLTSPVLTTPALGTPASGVMTNMTGAVTASLVDNAVTLAKMAGGTDGNLITYDTSGDPAYVATGTSGHVLTSAGADAVPTFAAGGIAASHDAVAKAWVNFDGEAAEYADNPAPIGSDYNVTSIDDNGTGTQTINFAITLDADYCWVGSVRYQNTSWAAGNLSARSNSPKTTTALTVCTSITSSLTFIDMPEINVVIFGV